MSTHCSVPTPLKAPWTVSTSDSEYLFWPSLEGTYHPSILKVTMSHTYTSSMYAVYSGISISNTQWAGNSVRLQRLSDYRVTLCIYCNIVTAPLSPEIFGLEGMLDNSVGLITLRVFTEPCSLHGMPTHSTQCHVRSICLVFCTCI